ncbi:hypothetical protein QBC41DRAFT_300916 [Cercophora samala]|uniref:Required for respiratory growth protein 7, mitochondrial n=1 Tax=Cercophora samala TaxID=330535 RepID=A0AA39ZHE9_9PEZI|nr:hypothetical protein QBC41DRAFT_300916 [Cercophora samala]
MRRLLLPRPSSLLRSTTLPTNIPRRAFRTTSAPLSTTTPSPSPSPSLDPTPPPPEQEEPPTSPPSQPDPEEQQPPDLPSPYTFPLPLAPSTNHSSLPTFLSYAAHTSLDPASTVYIGTHYEYTAILSLARLAFTLHRVGGRSDYGIDLLGFWSPLPPSSSRRQPPLKVLAQCKVTKTAKPQYVRELEGAFIGAPPGWRSKGVIGVLVAEKTATKGVRDAIGRSKWPMVYVVCSREGLVSQMLWNQRAVEEGGLEGLGVGSKYRVGEEGEQVEEVMLTWRGREVKPVKEKQKKEKERMI